MLEDCGIDADLFVRFEASLSPEAHGNLLDAGKHGNLLDAGKQSRSTASSRPAGDLRARRRGVDSGSDQRGAGGHAPLHSRQAEHGVSINFVVVSHKLPRHPIASCASSPGRWPMLSPEA
eukprot:5797064-Prymnesium_polylepis.1